jgi:hypothetical protein
MIKALVSIVLLAQLVCLGTMFSSCTMNETHYGSSTHSYYKKDLKKVVLSSNVNKCSKISR